MNMVCFRFATTHASQSNGSVFGHVVVVVLVFVVDELTEPLSGRYFPHHLTMCGETSVRDAMATAVRPNALEATIVESVALLVRWFTVFVRPCVSRRFVLLHVHVAVRLITNSENDNDDDDDKQPKTPASKVGRCDSDVEAERCLCIPGCVCFVCLSLFIFC